MDDLEADVLNATNSFLDNYTPDDFLTIDTRQALSDYLDDTVSTDEIQSMYMYMYL